MGRPAFINDLTAYSAPQNGRINALRLFAGLALALGYASTMPLSPAHQEALTLFGIQPGCWSLQLIFAISGYLAAESIRRHTNTFSYMRSKATRVLPALAIVSAVICLLVWPCLNTSELSVNDQIAFLSQYYLLNLTLIDPGGVMPGLMDEAPYMCLLQGAVWTLRNGAIFHLLICLSWQFQFFRQTPVIIAGCVASMSFYAVCLWFHATQPELLPSDHLHPFTQLAWPFVLGYTIRHLAYKGIQLSQRGWLILAVTCFIFAGFNHIVMPWTPLIEIAMVLSVLALGFAFLAPSLSKAANRSDMFAEFPPLLLIIYVVNWPISQVAQDLLPNAGSWNVIAISVSLSLATALVVRVVSGLWRNSDVLDKIVSKRALSASR